MTKPVPDIILDYMDIYLNPLEWHLRKRKWPTRFGHEVTWQFGPFLFHFTVTPK